MSLRFGRIDPEAHLPARQALFLDAFPETSGTSVATGAHYAWKFRSFPRDPPSYEYGAWDGDRLVGYYAAIPFPYVLDGEARTCGMVCDVMTHSASRGKGVFTRLGAYALDQMKEEGVDFVTGYPIRPEVLPGHLKVGWRVADVLPLWVKVLRADALLRPRGLSFAAPLANALARAYAALMRPGARHVKGLDLARGRADEADWKRLGPLLDADAFPCRLVKSPAFMRWRTGAPGAQYQAHLARDAAGAPAAYALTRFLPLQGIPTLAILDAVGGPGKGIPALHREIERHAREAGAEVVATMAGAGRASRLRLLRSGYVPTDRRFRLIVKPLSPRVSWDSLMRPDAWDVGWIDSDDL